MNPLNPFSPLGAYISTEIDNQVHQARPHELILILMNHALKKINQAKWALMHADQVQLGQCLGQAMAVIDELHASLDSRVDSSLVTNLDALYEYINTRLLHARKEGSLETLEQVYEILNTIKEGWEGIGDGC